MSSEYRSGSEFWPHAKGDTKEKYIYIYRKNVSRCFVELMTASSGLKQCAATARWQRWGRGEAFMSLI